MAISFDQISNWKKEYDKVYQINVFGETYIYRSLNIGDIQYNSNENISQLEKEEEIVNRVLLYPLNLNIDDSPAGVITFLYTCVIASAGVLNMEDISNMIDRARHEVENDINNNILSWKLMIIQVFPSYKLKDLDDMNPYDFFKLIALCEQVTGEKFVQFTRQPIQDNNVPQKKSKDLGVNNKNFAQIAEAEKAADKLLNAYKQGKGG